MVGRGRASGDRDRGDGRDRDQTELEELRPFIDLAREIRREVERIAADDTADVEQISDAIAAYPLAERRQVALTVFEQLPADVQWAILERVFDDDEIRGYLADEHHRRGARLGRTAHQMAVLDQARASRLLDTEALVEGDVLTVGLFRESGVRAATTRGHLSDACARSLVLRCVTPGWLRVIDDVFNPRGGFFVTRDYDESTWVRDRFGSYDRIRIGAAVDGPDGSSFEPVIHLGGRADFEGDAGVMRGHLHVGFVMLDDIDVFAGQG